MRSLEKRLEELEARGPMETQELTEEFVDSVMARYFQSGVTHHELTEEDQRAFQPIHDDVGAWQRKSRGRVFLNANLPSRGLLGI